MNNIKRKRKLGKELSDGFGYTNCTGIGICCALLAGQPQQECETEQKVLVK
jgi:hypothetical protein